MCKQTHITWISIFQLNHCFGKQLEIALEHYSRSWADRQPQGRRLHVGKAPFAALTVSSILARKDTYTLSFYSNIVAGHEPTDNLKVYDFMSGKLLQEVDVEQRASLNVAQFCDYKDTLLLCAGGVNRQAMVSQSFSWSVETRVFSL